MCSYIKHPRNMWVFKQVTSLHMRHVHGKGEGRESSPQAVRNAAHELRKLKIK